MVIDLFNKLVFVRIKVYLTKCWKIIKKTFRYHSSFYSNRSWYSSKYFNFWDPILILLIVGIILLILKFSTDSTSAGYRCGDNGCTKGDPCKDGEKNCYSDSSCYGLCEQPGYRCDIGCTKGAPCGDQEQACYSDQNCNNKCQPGYRCGDNGCTKGQSCGDGEPGCYSDSTCERKCYIPQIPNGYRCENGVCTQGDVCDVDETNCYPEDETCGRTLCPFPCKDNQDYDPVEKICYNRQKEGEKCFLKNPYDPKNPPTRWQDFSFPRCDPTLKCWPNSEGDDDGICIDPTPQGYRRDVYGR